MTAREPDFFLLLAAARMTERERVSVSLNLSSKSLRELVDQTIEIVARNPAILRIPADVPDERVLSCCLPDYHRYLALRDELNRRENLMNPPAETSYLPSEYRPYGTA